MSLWNKLFVEVHNGTKITYSESDLRKLDRTYERDLMDWENRRVMSPYRKEQQLSFLAKLRDFAYDKILDRHLYTFKHLLVVPNPYGLAKQTALLLFNSSKETKIVYRVLGDEGEDFVQETEYTTRHKVAIMGLYFKRSNKVDLSMVDRDGKVLKHRVIRIYVGDAPDTQRDVVSSIENQKDDYRFPMVMLNGATFDPLAMDANGDIRYALQLKTNRMGMIPLQNGHVLFADRTANCVNIFGEIQPCRYHEMDYMGRVYQTYMIEEPIGTVVTQHDNSLFLVTASDSEHRNDCIIEMDMETAEIVKRVDLASVIGDKYRDVEDWTMLSTMEYRNGLLLISIRRLHTIIALDWEEGKISWAIGQEEVWKDTDMCDLLVRCPRGAPLNFGRPDGANWLDDNNIILYNPNICGDVKGGYANANKSVIMQFEIDNDKKAWYKTCQYDAVKNVDYGNVIVEKDGKHVISISGSLAGKTEERKALISVLNWENGEITKNITLSKMVLNGWHWDIDIKDYSSSMAETQGKVVGRLSGPEVFTGEIGEPEEKKIPRKFFNTPHICGDLFIYNLCPGAIDKVYFVGENHKYVKDYSMLKPSTNAEMFAVQVDEMETDEYYIYLESRGKYYLLKNEIRIVK